MRKAANEALVPVEFMASEEVRSLAATALAQRWALWTALFYGSGGDEVLDEEITGPQPSGMQANWDYIMKRTAENRRELSRAMRKDLGLGKAGKAQEINEETEPSDP